MSHRRSIAALAAVGAALVAAAPASAASSATETPTASATVAATLEATLPTGTLAIPLAPGAPVALEETVNVKANESWGLKVFMDNADGKLMNGADALTNPLKLKIDSGTAATVPGGGTAPLTSQLFVDDTAATTAADTGTSVNLAFTQDWSYADKPGTYSAVITFQADTAFSS